MQILPPKFTDLRGASLSPTSTATVFEAGGELSTKLPLERLVEQAPPKVNPKKNQSLELEKNLTFWPRQLEKLATTFKKTVTYCTS